MTWDTRILDRDPVRGLTQYYHYDPDDDVIVIEDVWDVEPVVEDNKGRYAAIDERAGWKGDLHKVASLPMPVYWDWWHKTDKFKNQKKLRQLLNDPDNRFFRVRPGRV